MTDIKKEVVTALEKTGISVIYELFGNPSTPKPVITYMEIENSDDQTCDYFGYSNVTIRVKIWAEDVSTIQSKSVAIDTYMREIGFKRVASNELVVDEQICKILDYRCLTKETYQRSI